MKNFVFINHKCSQALVLDIAWTTNIESVMWVNELKKKMISVANLCFKTFSTFKCDQNDHSMEYYSCNWSFIIQSIPLTKKSQHDKSLGCMSRTLRVITVSNG